jgi:hypothetical protein
VGEDNLSDGEEEDESLAEALALYDRQAEEHSGEEEGSGDSDNDVSL